MTLSLTTPPLPSDSAFARVLAGMPKGEHWWHGNIVPYSEVQGVDLYLQATPGTVADIYVNGGLALRVDVTSPQQLVNLRLPRGYATILVKQGPYRFQTQVISANFATWLRPVADEVYASLERRIEIFEQHFQSYFSTRLVEHQIAFSDMFPARTDLAYRTLLTKLASRALISESFTTRGIEDIIASVTLSTPILTPQVATSYPGPPNPKYSDAQDFGGFDLFYWSPNRCLAEYHGFLRLIHMFSDGEHLVPVSATDERVVIRHEGTEYTQFFNTMDGQCTDLDDPCDDNQIVVTAITANIPSWICPWSKPFDVSVSMPLGRGRFDGNIPFDTGPTLDSMEDTAPLDGWMGVNVSGRFDEPSCLDSYVSGGNSLGVGCCPPPVVDVLVEFVQDIEIEIPDGVLTNVSYVP